MKISIRKKMLGATLFPILLLGVIISVVSTNIVTSSMHKQAEDLLHTAAYGCLNIYKSSATGDFVRNSEGVVSKGSSQISDKFDIIDNYKESSKIDLTFFYGDERIITTILDNEGNRVVGTKADKRVVDEVIGKGNTFFAKDLVIGGQKFFGYYLPVEQPSNGEVIGMMFTGLPQSHVNNTIQSVMRGIIIVAGIIMLGSFLIGSLYIGKLIKPLKRSVQVLDQVAEGNLNVAIKEKDLKANDETGEIAKATLKLKNSLTDMIEKIRISSNILSDSALKLDESVNVTNKTSSEVGKAINDISTGALSQAEETQDASENIVHMGKMIEGTLSEVVKLSENANEIKTNAKEAMEVLDELSTTNDKTKESVELIKEQTNLTNESALKIKAATALITSIATETNLLSLNASIEAARAGEEGRGFAVVASQIQKLAEQSNASAVEIENIINILIDDSNRAVETMEEVTEVIKVQSDNVDKTKGMFAIVNQEIETTITGVEKISTQAKELNSKREVVISSVENLSAIAEENAAATEETTASVDELANIMMEIADEAKELKNLSVDLQKDVEVFKLK